MYNWYLSVIRFLYTPNNANIRCNCSSLNNLLFYYYYLLISFNWYNFQFDNDVDVLIVKLMNLWSVLLTNVLYTKINLKTHRHLKLGVLMDP